MAEWSIDDNLALMVGRVIMAFGNLDQAVYHHIMMFQSIASRIARRTEDESWYDNTEMDHRFAHRLALLRRLADKVTGNNREYMCRYDKWQTAVKVIEAKRGVLAHGIIYPASPGLVHVYEQRDEARRDAEFRKHLPNISDEEAYKLWEQLKNPQHSVEELWALPNAIFEARQELFRLRKEAQRLADGIGNPPTHGR